MLGVITLNVTGALMPTLPAQSDCSALHGVGADAQPAEGARPAAVRDRHRERLERARAPIVVPENSWIVTVESRRFARRFR